MKPMMYACAAMLLFVGLLFAVAECSKPAGVIDPPPADTTQAAPDSLIVADTVAVEVPVLPPPPPPPPPPAPVVSGVFCEVCGGDRPIVRAQWQSYTKQCDLCR